MVLKAIESLLNRQDMIPVRVGSSYPVRVPQDVYQFSNFHRPEPNLAEAQRKNMHPVNYMDVKKQFTPDQLANAVLFDTVPGGILGNHWRVVEANDNLSSIGIQYTSGFGVDVQEFPVITLSQYDILFTGLSIFEYQTSEKWLSLAKLNEYIQKEGDYPKNIKRPTQEIYFSDATGKLIPMKDHPLYPHA